MKTWLKSGLILGILAIIPVILGIIITSQITEECLGCLILFVPSILFWNLLPDTFQVLVTFSFFFNLIFGFLIGAIIGLIIQKIKSK